MKFLFITSRNVVNTCGELRLIKNRAKCLSEKYGFTGDFLVYRNDLCSQKPMEEIGEEFTLQQFLYPKNKICSMKKQAKLLTEEVLSKLQKDSYDVVILSGNMVLFLAKLIKKKFPNKKIVIDVHGAIEELKEFKGKSFKEKLIRKLAYGIMRRQEKKYMKHADAFFAVSVALKKYLIDNYGLKNKEFFIVPCSQKQQVLDVETKKSNRVKYRQKYNISENEKLFIYSGGLSPWQCVEEAVVLFKKVAQSVPNCKMILFTGDQRAIEKYQSDNIMVDSLPFNLVNDVICAGDYAFMLRGDYVTNHVAYPNKFIEYVCSGMKVIATPFVKDVATQIMDHEIGIVLEEIKEDSLIEYVKNSKSYMDDVESRQKLLDDVCFENRLKPFFDFVNDKDLSCNE